MWCHYLKSFILLTLTLFIFDRILCLPGVGSSPWDMLRMSLRRWSQVRWSTVFDSELTHVSCWATACLCAPFFCVSTRWTLRRTSLNGSGWLTGCVWTDGLWLCVSEENVNETLHSFPTVIPMTDYREKNWLGVWKCLQKALDHLSEWACYPQMPPPLLTIDHSAAGLVVLLWL